MPIYILEAIQKKFPNVTNRRIEETVFTYLRDAAKRKH